MYQPRSEIAVHLGGPTLQAVGMGPLKALVTLVQRKLSRFFLTMSLR